MKRRHLFVVIAIGALLVVGAFSWRRVVQAQAAWNAARPAEPDLRQWPEPFRTRVAGAEARLAARPPDVAALGELARLYHANGFLGEAELAYRGLLVFDPQNAQWPHLLATLLAGYGRLEEAVPLLRRAVTLAPEYVPARLRLGDALLKGGQASEAGVVYRDLLTHSPEHPYALLGLARIDIATGRLTAAREELSRAVKADPKFFGAQSLLASVFEQLGNDQAAATARSRADAAGRFHDAPDPWVDELTDVCYDVYRLQIAAAGKKAAGATRDAVALLQRALTLAPNDARTQRQLGGVLIESHDFSGAREHLEKAIALEPHEVASYLDLVNDFLETKDYPAAIRVAETGLTLCTDRAGLHFQLALLLVATHRLEESLPHFREAVRLSPEKPDVAHELVARLLESGREPEAAAALESALARNPEFPPLLVLSTRRKIAQHTREEAARELHHAVQAGASAEEVSAVSAEYRRAFGRDP